MQVEVMAIEDTITMVIIMADTTAVIFMAAELGVNKISYKN